MGRWGNDILQDDVAAEVYSKYLEMYNGSSNHNEIRERLLSEYPEAQASPSENPDFWLAFAHAQWDCGALEPQIFEIVKKIVTEKVDLDLCEGPARQQRSATLHNFLVRIATDNDKPLKRRKQRKIVAPFSTGDCLSVKLSGEWHGAAIVLGVDSSSREEDNLVGLLHYKSTDKPFSDIFSERKWMCLTHHNWNDVTAVYTCLASYYNSNRRIIEKVGTTAIRCDDPINSIGITGWSLDIFIEAQFNWEEMGRKLNPL